MFLKLYELGSEHYSLLLHTLVQWLSREKIVERVFELQEELLIFLIEHNADLASLVADEICLGKLAYRPRFSANPLASAIVKDDGKVEFLQSLADRFSSWSKARSGLYLSQQTFQTTVLTLQAQARLVTDLLQEGHDFVK